MCTSTAFWVPSACGIAALPRKVPSLTSAIDAFTTATMLALSASAIFSCAPWVVFTVRTLPSTFSIVPLTRWVCAAALVHTAAISAPASAPRMVLVIAPSPKYVFYKYIRGQCPFEFIATDVIGRASRFVTMSLVVAAYFLKCAVWRCDSSAAALSYTS
jgi:hypothetical protein